DYLIPTYESYITHNPLLTLGLGWFFGSRFGANATGRRIGGVVGALVLGLGSTKRWITEQITGETFIPERRQKEREIEEYFDILEYLKYKGLYDRYADLAWEHEGIELDSYLFSIEASGSERKA